MNSVDGVLSVNNNKPDVMISFKIKKQKVTLFFVKVKRPEQASKYQVEDDFTKLLKQLKVSIDHQIHLKIKKPRSFGLFVEGNMLFFGL